MSKRVALVSHSDYELRGLKYAIERAIDLCGFDLKSTTGKKVLLKPNMLGAYKPSRHVTTNPQFVMACAMIFKEAGAIVSVGDSPNGVFAPKDAWALAGFDDVCKRLGIAAASFEGAGSRNIGGIWISNAALDADIVVNLPKFKTHGLTVLTVAVKNMFGCVPGMMKSKYHRENPDRKDFAELIVRACEAVKPGLNIVDGIVAMDGNGPSAGGFKELGIIAAGMDPYRIDAACSKLVGLDPFEVDTMDAAARLGVINKDLDFEVVGDDIVEIRDFELPSTYTKRRRDWAISRFVLKRIWNNVSSKPKINVDVCVKCHLCVKACPVGAIDAESPGTIPKIDYKKCIECLCCHEVCPHRAIDIVPSFLVRIGRALVRLNRRRR
jgi:uncharacterized protein (DUF362 family)/Pyruvate/2-oxoacid:ferredoxin oxidoreductase delta subunit